MSYADKLRNSLKTDKDRFSIQLKSDIDYASKQFRNGCFNASANHGKSEFTDFARIEKYDSAAICLFYNKKPLTPREASMYGASYCNYNYCCLMANGLKKELKKDSYKKLSVEIVKFYEKPDALIFKGKLSYKIYLHAVW